jgi:hypothetical protein
MRHKKYSKFLRNAHIALYSKMLKFIISSFQPVPASDIKIARPEKFIDTCLAASGVLQGGERRKPIIVDRLTMGLDHGAIFKPLRLKKMAYDRSSFSMGER